MNNSLLLVKEQRKNMAGGNLGELISGPGLDSARDQLVEADAFGLGTQCRAAVRLRAHAKQDLAAVRPSGGSPRLAQKAR